MEEFHISQRYLDPKFHKEENVGGFLGGCSRIVAKGESRQRQQLIDIALLLESSPEGIADHKQFDPVYSLCCDSIKLSRQVRNLLQESLVAGCGQLLTKLESVGDDKGRKTLYRNCVKMYSFLLCTFANTSEMAKQQDFKNKEDFDAFQKNWAKKKEPLLGGLTTVLDLDELVKTLWSMSTPEEDFGTMFFKTAVKMFEDAKNLKNEALREVIHRIIAVSLGSFTRHLIAVFASFFVHFLTNNEVDATARHVADLCGCLARDYGQKAVVGQMLREISRTKISHERRDTKTAKSLSMFLQQLTHLLPELVLKDISVITATHLEGESHVMRNAVIQMMGELIIYRTENHPQSKSQLQSEQINKLKLLDIVEERVHDVHGYTRSQALKTLIKLVDHESPNSELCIPVERLPSILACALDRLKDKTSNTRSNALTLLTRIVERNPFGPSLSMDQFKGRLEELNARIEEIRKAVEAIELQKARQHLAELKVNEETNEDDSFGHNEEDVVMADEEDAEKAGEEDAVMADEEDMEEKKEEEEEEEDAKENQADQLAIIFQRFKISPEDFKELQAKRLLFTLACKFIEDIEECAPILLELLSSQKLTDPLKTIAFLKIASNFNLKFWRDGYREMLKLIWLNGQSQEKVKNAVIDAYTHVHFPKDLVLEGVEGQKNAQTVAFNLLRLLHARTLRDLASVEELIKSMAEANIIKPEVVRSLWEFFVFGASESSKKVSTKQSTDALRVLCMIASANGQSEIIHKKLKVIVQFGLGDEPKRDNLLALVACRAIKRTALVKPLPPEFNEPITSRICEIIRGGYVTGLDWYAAAQEAVSTLFTFHPHPNEICQRLIEEMSNAAFNQLQEEEKEHKEPQPHPPSPSPSPSSPGKGDDGGDQSTDNKDAEMADSSAEPQSSNSQSSAGHNSNGSSPNHHPPSQTQSPHSSPSSSSNQSSNTPKDPLERISKLFFVVGQMAIKILVRLEEFDARLKKLRQKQDRREEAIAASQRTQADAAIESELGYVHGEKDAEIDQMTEKAQEDMLENGIFSRLVPLLVYLCKSCLASNRKKTSALESSAVLCLCNFMCVSRTFCEEHLQLLFTILTQSKDDDVKANVVTALGDMASRFPNLLAPWSKQMYASLNDDDIVVRKNALLVMTHLILNDMIKVRESISDIAYLMLDEEPTISERAKMFFQELSKRGKNPIYNILPDTISRLSMDDRVDQAKFRIIMKELMNYIKDSKKLESLVRQLCQRFDTTHETSRHQDIAYCLSLLQYNEKCLQRLSDPLLMKTYSHLLADDQIYKCFKEIIKNTKKSKSQRPAMKELLEEFEKKITQLREKRSEEKETDERADLLRNKKGNKKKSQRILAGKTGNRNKKRRVAAQVEEEEEEAGESDTSDSENESDLPLESESEEEEDSSSEEEAEAEREREREVEKEVEEEEKKVQTTNEDLQEEEEEVEVEDVVDETAEDFEVIDDSDSGSGDEGDDEATEKITLPESNREKKRARKGSISKVKEVVNEDSEDDEEEVEEITVSKKRRKLTKADKIEVQQDQVDKRPKRSRLHPSSQRNGAVSGKMSGRRRRTSSRLSSVEPQEPPPANAPQKRRRLADVEKMIDSGESDSGGEEDGIEEESDDLPLEESSGEGESSSSSGEE